MDKMVELVWTRRLQFKYEVYFLYEDGTWELILECDSRDHIFEGSINNRYKKTKSQQIKTLKKILHTKEWYNPKPGVLNQTYHEFKFYED